MNNRIKTVLIEATLIILLACLVSYCGYVAVANAHNNCKEATTSQEDYRFCMGI